MLTCLLIEHPKGIHIDQVIIGEWLPQDLNIVTTTHVLCHLSDVWKLPSTNEGNLFLMNMITMLGTLKESHWLHELRFNLRYQILLLLNLLDKFQVLT